MIQRNLADIVEALQKGNRKLFIGLNWWWSPGHMTVEIDFISRMLILDEPLRNSRPLLILAPTEATTFAAKALIHSNLNVEIILTNHAFQIQREIALFYPELVIRAGYWDFRSRPNLKPNHENNLSFLFCEQYDEMLEFQRSMNLTYKKTSSISIFKNYVEEQLKKQPEKNSFLNFLNEVPYVSFQIKGYKPDDKIWNGAAMHVKPEIFEKTLSYIRDQGYRIILSGREDCPDLFKKYGAYDYPKSEFCSYENDFLLAANAKKSITQASGLAHIYDFLKVDMLSVGRWRIWPLYSNTSTLLPMRIKDSLSNTILSFGEQIRAVENIYRPQADVFVLQDRYTALELDSDYIFESFKELISPTENLIQKKEIVRERARNDDEYGLWKLSGNYLPSCTNDFYKDYIN
jgi:putative glycosyltransferase (TIGR04372 family)